MEVRPRAYIKACALYCSHALTGQWGLAGLGGGSTYSRDASTRHRLISPSSPSKLPSTTTPDISHAAYAFPVQVFFELVAR